MPAAVSSTPNAPEERTAGGSTGGAAADDNQNSREDRMWKALKLYITRDRQRKRKEYEAEVEEERLRKEKEARQRQDVMTLEETKEQIEQLEQKLKQLEKEKQQLFKELKKVLNEDRQLQAKENTEMANIKMQMGNIQLQMFHPPTSTGQGEPPPNQGRPPPLTSHLHNKGNIQQVSGVKRQRSPSPVPSHNMYQHRVHMQPPLKHQVYPDHSQHKIEDGRLARLPARAVLWNKPTQYNTAGVSQAGAYYHLPTSGGVVGVVNDRPPPMLYGHTPHHNLMYAPAAQPQLYIDMVKPQHQDNKEPQCQQPQVLIGLSDSHHTGGGVGVNVSSYTSQPPPRHHVNVHATMPHDQGAKPGSITQGYPVRQPNPNVQNPNMYPNKYRY